MSSLLDSFLAARSPERADIERDEKALLDALQRAYQVAKTAHPEIQLAAASFATYLGERLETESSASTGLAAVHVADLFLCCACLCQEKRACDVFYELLQTAAGPAVSRYCSDPSDVLQGVSEKLIVGTHDGPPRLGDYGGKGELATWLRVIAVRAAISLRRKRGEVLVDDSELWGFADADLDQRRALEKQHSLSAVKAAFQIALTELEAKDRLLLRQHLLDDLSIDEIGPMHGVHRVTAARWLTRARSRLWSLVKQRLRAQLGLNPAEIDSLLQDVRSTLDLSIERVLALEQLS